MNKIPLAILICKGAHTITLGSSLVGGHLTLSYLLFEPDAASLDTYFITVLSIIGMNFIYFLGIVGLQLIRFPQKAQLRNAALGMLWNIPITFFYLYILITYGF